MAVGDAGGEAGDPPRPVLVWGAGEPQHHHFLGRASGAGGGEAVVGAAVGGGATRHLGDAGVVEDLPEPGGLGSEGDRLGWCPIDPYRVVEGCPAGSGPVPAAGAVPLAVVVGNHRPPLLSVLVDQGLLLIQQPGQDSRDPGRHRCPALDPGLDRTLPHTQFGGEVLPGQPQRHSQGGELR